MNWGMVLGAGLLAGATTCAVTQGGLLVGLITRQRRAAGTSHPGARASLREDLAPVGGFLAGKLVSHTLAGALLGAAGSAFGFSPRVGAIAQLVAGALLLVLGLGALGVPGFRDVQFTPPESWLAVVRRRTRSRATGAPFLLGLAVVLIPCGVTISMEVLAATSGSPVTGAAVMALFVLGTAPMFTLYGWVSQRIPFGRLMSGALGALVVAFGVITFNAGLVAGGSPWTIQSAIAGDRATPDAGALVAAGPAVAAGTVQDVEVTVVADGYEPAVVTARAGSFVRITFTTDHVWSCAIATTLPTLDKQVLLPPTGRTTLDLGVLEAGDYPISCSMGMYTATLRVTA